MTFAQALAEIETNLYISYDTHTRNQDLITATKKHDFNVFVWVLSVSVSLSGVYVNVSVYVRVRVLSIW